MVVYTAMVSNLNEGNNHSDPVAERNHFVAERKEVHVGFILNTCELKNLLTSRVLL